MIQSFLHGLEGGMMAVGFCIPLTVMMFVVGEIGNRLFGVPNDDDDEQEAA